MYGIARWYIAGEQSKPLTLGVSFIPSYAESLGLDPKVTMDALIKTIGVRHFRLVSYWDELEPQEGHYDFSSLDWQFQKAEAAHAKIVLSIGLRQPRWPECHMPDWAADEPKSQWQPQLETFMTQVITRYKGSAALDTYQLENEFFLPNFGTCTDYSSSRLIEEFNLVKKLDPHHPIMLSRSDNSPDWLLGAPKADIVGMSVYRKVWAPNIHHYFTYPLPPWYYAFLAGTQKLLTGQNSMIHELQMEPWPPDRKLITNSSLAEQNQTFDAQAFRQHVQFGEATGIRQLYMWGAEYWYYRLTREGDSSLWNAAKTTFQH